MISQVRPTVKESLILNEVARQVLIVGAEHINYNGGIGSVLNVYAKHFETFNKITTHKPLPNKALLIPFFLKQYVRFAATLLTNQQLRIVHIHGSSYGSFYRKLLIFWTAKYMFRRKTIYHMHGSEFMIFYRESNSVVKGLIKFLVENTDVLCCLSQAWHDFFAENFQPKRIEIIGNVIHSHDTNLETYKPIDTPLTVLFLGAIGRRKGIFDLLDVLKQHKLALEGKIQVLIGGNGEVDRLQDFIKENDLTRLVRYEGWVSGAKKRQLLYNSDIYILPSYNEGLPLSILEAMSYQLPILSTPVGGTAEVVIDNVNGFLVQPGDKQAIFERLSTFIERPDLVQQMGNESAQIIKRYQPEAIFPILRSIYERLLARD